MLKDKNRIMVQKLIQSRDQLATDLEEFRTILKEDCGDSKVRHLETFHLGGFGLEDDLSPPLKYLLFGDANAKIKLRD